MLLKRSKRKSLHPTKNKGLVKKDIESLTVSTKTVSTPTASKSKSNANSDAYQNDSIAVENGNDHTEDQERAKKQSIKPTDQQRNVTRRRYP